MKWGDIKARLNGATLGPIGVQWIPKPSDEEIARRVIHFLEDRRVLFNDYAWEEPSHCIDSVVEIRRVLTDEIRLLPADSDILNSLRVMRASCRKFLDRVHIERSRMVHLYGRGEFAFHSALGELRGGIGPQVALLSSHFQIDIEDELAKTLPLEDSDASM